MEIYNYEEISDIISQGIGVMINNSLITIDSYNIDDLFFLEGYVENPMNTPSIIKKVGVIDNKKVQELFKYLKKTKNAKLSELQEVFYDSAIYGLKYKDLIIIEDGIVKLK